MTNKIADVSASPNLLTELRKLMPARALRAYEHFIIAERQANRLHELLHQTGPPADLAWLANDAVPTVTVVMQPQWRMEGLSGITSWTTDQGWIIGVNKNNPPARRRFTLAHEFKHVLDANRDKITYRGLTEPQREMVADYFAACYLMPKLWLRRAWTRGLQDPEALAGLFMVSQQAMKKRLRHFGFVDDDEDRTVASYFRRGSMPSNLAS